MHQASAEWMGTVQQGRDVWLSGPMLPSAGNEFHMSREGKRQDKDSPGQSGQFTEATMNQGL